MPNLKLILEQHRDLSFQRSCVFVFRFLNQVLKIGPLAKLGLPQGVK